MYKNLSVCPIPTVTDYKPGKPGQASSWGALQGGIHHPPGELPLETLILPCAWEKSQSINQWMLIE